MRRITALLTLMVLFTTSIFATPAAKGELTSTISYTATEKLKFEDKMIFGVKIKSHKFDKNSGQGYIVLSGELCTIPNNTFSNIQSLKHITIPKGTTSIGENAFSDCINLQTICIPNSVMTIGNSAFVGCTSLEGITLPDSIIEIGVSAFQKCSNLQNITISKALKIIGKDAFKECNSTPNVYINDLDAWCKIDFNNIAANPLHNKANLFVNGELATNIIIPDNTTQICSYAFYNCPTIQRVTIPGNISRICNDAFKYCDNITEVRINDLMAWCKIDFNNIAANPLHNKADLLVNGKLATNITIPDNTTQICSYAFYNCPTIQRVTIPGNLSRICNDAFRYCDNITGVYINDLDSWCKIDFANQDSNPLTYAKKLYLNGELVKEITLPESITTLKEYTFSCCHSLESITTNNGLITADTHTFDKCVNLQNITSDNLDALKSLLSIHSFSTVTLGNSITEIPKEYFINNMGLLVVYLTDSVTKIGESAFSGCKSLQRVNIPSSITEIEDYAFANCTSIQGVYINDLEAWLKITFKNEYSNPLQYGKNLYLNSELVTSIVIPDSITEIGDYTFHGCDSLTSIVFPKSMEKIGTLAFLNCNNIKTVECNSLTTLQYIVKNYRNTITTLSLGSGITSIPNYCFSECKSLQSITLPEGIRHIGSGAFYACEQLRSIYIPKSVKTVEYDAFMYCMRLDDVHIDDISAWCNITFDSGEFSNPLSNGCSLYIKGELATDIIIPSNVKTIGSSAFKGCTSIKSVILAEGVNRISDKAFEDCTSLHKVKIANSVRYIDDAAFIGCKSLTELNLGSGVTSIGNWAFSGCTSLLDVTIPKSVRHIGTGAFTALYSDGNALQIIILKGTVPPSMGQNVIPRFTTVYVPRGSIYSYLSSGWRTYQNNMYER